MVSNEFLNFKMRFIRYKELTYQYIEKVVFSTVNIFLVEEHNSFIYY